MTDMSGNPGSRGGQRRVSRRFRIPERRDGFDRRRPREVLLILRDNPWLLLALLVALNLLSAVDWGLTLNALRNGAAEGNPLLASMIAMSPMSAAAFKFGVIGFVSVALWEERRYRLILATAIVGVALYAMLIPYHVIALAGADVH